MTDRPDHTTPLSACAGDALVDQLFTDVSMGHVLRDAINCIAYYEITHGTGDGSTYSPEQDVTRAQMAVFIARAAEVAGVELGPVGAAGFDDIAETWGEAQDAINRLASKGMIPSGGAYRPNDAITRAEMATFLIGLMVEAAPDVTKDSQGTILLGVGGSLAVADDTFPDVDNAEVSAIYELGITKGASAADVQDGTDPPLDFNYEPDATVDRGQMAAFITRALAHTSVRPEGISAQFDGADVIVSVRDAQYRPVSGAAVDVFWATADEAERAVSANGTCRHSVVTQADSSSFPCEIDGDDPVTGNDGDARVAVTGLRRVPEGGATVWAWTGPVGATVQAGVDLHILDVAEGADIGYATTTLVTTSFDARKARFGSTVLYTLQLQDLLGNVPTGVNGIDPARWQLSVQVAGQDAEIESLMSSPTGRVSFSISVVDPTPGADDDVTVTYRLSAADNAPSGAVTVLANGEPAATGTLIFSDDAPSISSGNATVTIDARDYVHLSGRSRSTSVTVTVLDQYGDPFPGARVSLNGGPERTVNSRGSHRFSHQYSGPAGGQTETLTARYGESSASIVAPTHQVHWAVDAGPSDDGTARAVLAGDVRTREIVVDDGTGPALLVYDGNDRFNLEGDPTSMAGFEAALATALRRDAPGVELEWSNYLAGSDGRVTEYDLSTS
ncbi:MAG: S-layer homology domain-containing protein [Acidimicrobiaceae bacterium]|nr:S-layer homology domain-containing protein [Acidimicrobiaceae bacterium]